MFWHNMWLALAMVAAAMVGWLIYDMTHPSHVPCRENSVGCGLANSPD